MIGRRMCVVGAAVAALSAGVLVLPPAWGAAPAAGGVPGGDEPPAGAVLRHLARAARAAAETAFSGEQIVAVWTRQATHLMRVRVEADPPAWVRLEFNPVGSAEREVVVRREHDEIRYDPLRRTGRRRLRPVALEEPDDVFLMTYLPWLRASYRATRTPGTVLGRPTERWDLRPVTPDRPTRRIELDATTGLVLRSERLAADGSSGQFTAFLRLELQPRGWRRGARVPPDLRLTEASPLRPVSWAEAARRLGRAPVPVVVPAGFHPVAQYLVDGPPPMLLVTYSDGLNVLIVHHERGTLAAPPPGSRFVGDRRHGIWLRQEGLQYLVHWQVAGWRLTVVGAVEPGSLVRAAHATGAAPPPRVLDVLVGRFRAPGEEF
jgi:hypothetical protein